VMDKEHFVVGVFAAGVAVDHATTLMGLMTEKLVELNPFTNQLINTRLWLIFEVLLVGALSYATTSIYSKWRHPGKWTILIIPVFIGIARLCAGINNIILLFRAI